MQTLVAGNLVLEPLTVAHADAMFDDVLGDPRLYAYLDYGPPPSRQHVRESYARLESRRSPDGEQQWLNWIIRGPTGDPLGYVQATVVSADTSWVAWLLASRHWGLGHAATASRAMIDHLQADHRIATFLATVEVANARSIALLDRLSFRPATADRAAHHALTPTERLFVREGSMP